MHRYILILLTTVPLITCGFQQEITDEYDVDHQPDSIVVFLNDKAVLLMGKAMGYAYDTNNKHLYDSALIYLQKAVEIDSLYMTAYFNIAQVLRITGQLEKSLQVLEIIESIEPYAELYLGKGFLLEKMGKVSQAHEEYSKALRSYNLRIKNYPDSVEIKLDRIYVYLFLDGKNKALERIQRLSKEYPNNEQIKTMREIFVNFDRSEFIADF